MKKTLLIVSLASMTFACTKSPENISAINMPTSLYQGKSCAELVSQRNAVVTRLNSMTSAQKAEADKDAAMVAVGTILFFPALFALGGEDFGADIARAKGEFDAITTVARAQGCQGFEPETAIGRAKQSDEELGQVY